MHGRAGGKENGARASGQGGGACERKRDGVASGRGRERTRGFRAAAALLVVGAALCRPE